MSIVSLFSRVLLYYFVKLVVLICEEEVIDLEFVEMFIENGVCVNIVDCYG